LQKYQISIFQGLRPPKVLNITALVKWKSSSRFVEVEIKQKLISFVEFYEWLLSKDQVWIEFDIWFVFQMESVWEPAPGN
jgi:hypothetical protein